MKALQPHLSPHSRYYLRKLVHKKLEGLKLHQEGHDNSTTIDLEQVLERLDAEESYSNQVAELEHLTQLHQGLSTQGNLYKHDVVELETKVLSLLGVQGQQSLSPSQADRESNEAISITEHLATVIPITKGTVPPVAAAQPVAPATGTEAAESTNIAASLSVLNQLSQLGQKYLGHRMVVNYWQVTRPSKSWLSQFQVDQSGIVTHPDPLKVLSLEEQKDLQQWIRSFIQQASSIIHNFAQLTQRAAIVLEKSTTPSVLQTKLQPHQETEELRRAIAQDELRVHYQPIVMLDSLQIVGFEALVRWQHPQKGLLPPSEFIPLASTSGLIVDLDRWVLRSACAQLSQWQTQYSFATPLSMSVNLSGQQFTQPGLAENVDMILREAGISANCLKLEVTEEVMATNVQIVSQILKQLKEMQVQLSIDDFGTGYSSLSRLQEFPLDILKIDRSFVQYLEQDSSSDEIISTIITLAHSLGMKVVAEGVETSKQLGVLKSHNCEYVQGYFCYRPLPAKELSNLFQTHPSIFMTQTDMPLSA